MRQIESNLQQGCKRWFDLQFPKLAKAFYAVPNGGWRTKTTARRMKREGVVAGVADMHLAVKNNTYGSLFIEFKTKEGSQSQAQKEFERTVTAFGQKYVVIRTFEGFRAVICDYLSDSNNLLNRNNLRQKNTL